MLNLDFFEWLLLLYGYLLFRLFFVVFFRVGRLGHLEEGRNFGHTGVTPITPFKITMVMDSDVVLLGTDLPSSILAASVLYFSKTLSLLT